MIWEGLKFLMDRFKIKKAEVTLTYPLESGYDRDEDERRRRQAIVTYAFDQIGKPYVFGVENSFDVETRSWDCSELVEHAYRRGGLYMPDGSWNQFEHCRPVINPEPGDLGWLFSSKLGRTDHVVMYVGSGRVVEAVGGYVYPMNVRPYLIKSSKKFPRSTRASGRKTGGLALGAGLYTLECRPTRNYQRDHASSSRTWCWPGQLPYGHRC